MSVSGEFGTHFAVCRCANSQTKLNLMCSDKPTSVELSDQNILLSTVFQLCGSKITLTCNMWL